MNFKKWEIFCASKATPESKWSNYWVFLATVLFLLVVASEFSLIFTILDQEFK